MRIAIPTAEGLVCMHFGHCEEFTILDVDPESKSITNTQAMTPPAHEPGVLPRWLGEQGVNLVIAGGMGSRAQSLFAQAGIKVVVGAESGSPASVAVDYLNGTLSTGTNICDH